MSWPALALVFAGAGCSRGTEPVDGLPSVLQDTAVTTVGGYHDADGDGYGGSPARLGKPVARLGGDCDDDDPEVHPAADELCNGYDDDCDGRVDVDALDALNWYDDADHDGYGDPNASTLACEQPEGTTEEGLDCDDAEPDVHPGAEGPCGIGVDWDCDGLSYCVDYFEDAAVIVGVEPESYFGWRVAAADLNGDGWDDIAVSAIYEGQVEGVYTGGAVYVIAGPFEPKEERLAASGARLVDPTGTAIKVGHAIDAGGDTNGDGVRDLAVASTSARAMLVHGPVPRTGTLEPATVFVSTADGGGVTEDVRIGDVTGDGIDDVVVGVPLDIPRWAQAAYVFHGPVPTGEVALADADGVIVGEDEQTGGVVTVALPGDIEGDGISDVVLNVCHCSWGVTGVIYVASGPVVGEILPSDADGRLVLDNRAYVFELGDANRDGAADLAVGMVLEDEAWVVYGPVEGVADLEDAVDVTLLATEAGGGWGYSMAAAVEDGDTSALLVSMALSEYAFLFIDTLDVPGTVEAAHASTMITRDMKEDPHADWLRSTMAWGNLGDGTDRDLALAGGSYTGGLPGAVFVGLDRLPGDAPPAASGKQGD